MFSLNKIHNNAFGGIGDRYAHYIDPHHFLGRNGLDDALWNSRKAKSNVTRADNQYHVEIAVPGFAREEIQVNLVGDHLVVECTKTEFQDVVPDQIHKEYGHNQISRTFLLPNEVDQDGIRCQHQNGVLGITLPIRNRKKKSVTVQ